MIFKIQKSFNSDMCLIYNYDRSYFGELPMTISLDKLFGYEMKIYVKGTIDAQGVLHIQKRVKDRSW